MKFKTKKTILRYLEIVHQSTNDAITIQDFNGNILEWNAMAENMYGYSKAEAMKMNISQIIPKHKLQENQDCLLHSESGKSLPGFKTQRLSKKGKLLEVWIIINGFPNDVGIIDLLITTEHDITDHNIIKGKDINQSKKLLPICANCKGIRDNNGKWHKLELFLKEHYLLKCSHGICQECMKKLYPDYFPKL